MAQLRERAGRLELSYSEVARQADMSVSQTTKILKAQKPVTLEELDVLCGVLQVRLSAIVTAAEARVIHDAIMGRPSSAGSAGEEGDEAQGMA